MMDRMSRAARRSAGRRASRRGRGVTALVLLGVVVVGLLGCSADAPGDGQPSESDASEAALQVTTVHGADQLDGQARADLEAAVGDVLSEFVVEGFLGTYPRTDFVRGLASFSPGIADTAAANLDLLTAARYQDSAGVRASRLEARLSFLADGDTVVGATANVDFAFEADVDGETRPFTLTGRLMLEEDDGTWTVFGYDVARDDGSEVEALVSP
jgi:hypothetical protein